MRRSNLPMVASLLLLPFSANCVDSANGQSGFPLDEPLVKNRTDDSSEKTPQLTKENFGWKPERKEIVLHSLSPYSTLGEKERKALGNLDHDRMNYNKYDLKNFGWHFDVNYELIEGLANRRDAHNSGEDKVARVFFGLEGPFGSNALHLFECPSSATKQANQTAGQANRYRFAWSADDFFVACNPKGLTYAVPLDGASSESQSGEAELKEFDAPSEGSSFKALFESPPPVDVKYLKWWQSIKVSLIEGLSNNGPDINNTEKIAKHINVYVVIQTETSLHGLKASRLVTLRHSDGSYPGDKWIIMREPTLLRP